MTARERQRIDALITRIDLKLTALIEKLQHRLVLKDFEIDRLRVRLANARPRKPSTNRSRPTSDRH